MQRQREFRTPLLQVFSYGSTDLGFKQAALICQQASAVRQSRYHHGLHGGASRVQRFEHREVRTSGQSCNKAVSFADWEQRMALTHATACALDVKLSWFPARWCKCVSALGNEVSSRFAEMIRGFEHQCSDPVERLDVPGADFFQISQVRHRKLLFSSHVLLTLLRSNLKMM